MSKNIIKVVLAMLVLLPVVLVAQNLPCRTYGGVMNEKAHALVNSFGEDGGYVMAGFTEMPLDTNALIVRIDSSGNVLQAKLSIGGNTEVATSMIRTYNMGIASGYVLTGWTRSHGIGIPKSNIFVIKVDTTLNVLWGKVYSMMGTYEDQAYSIIEVMPPDSGYAVVGWTEYGGGGPSPAIVVMRLEPSGLQRWTRIYHRRVIWEPSPLIMPSEGYDIVELPPFPPTFPGGFAVTGRAVNPYWPTANWDAFVMCIDTGGTVYWLKSLGGQYEDEGYSIIFDGAITAAGWTDSYGPGTGAAGAPANIFAWKMDMLGNDIWKNAYGWMNNEEKLMDEQSLMLANDGNYALAGWTKSVGPGVPNPNFLIMKVEPTAGGIFLSRVHPSIPGAQSEKAYPIIHTISGGYAIAGFTNSFGVGGVDFHFLTLDQSGNRPVCVLDEMPLIEAILWTEPESAVYFVEFFDTTHIELRDTMVQYTDVCAASVDTSDVGPTGIFFTPASPVDSTANVTPSAYLYNYGNTTVDYTAQMTIGSFYTGTFAVTNHAPLTTIQADFPSATDWPRGLHTVKCTTQLTGDRDNTNDSMTGQLMVYVHDVGAVQINQPAGNVDSVASLTPQAKVKNFGNVSENFNVKFTIDGPAKATWTDDTLVTVGAGNELTIDFDAWTVAGTGNYTTKCSTELSTDMDGSNDKQDSVFTVVGQMDYNVGTVAIYMPTAGNIDSVATITPQAKVKNYGTGTETFNVKFTIDGPAKATWTDDTSVTLNTLEELTIDFDAWTVGPQGDYTAKCSTELATDLFADNDKKEVSFAIVVAPPVTPGWAQKESVPKALDIKAGKYVKDGGALVGVDDEVYVFHGNKSWQFYKYTPGAVTPWSTLCSIPMGLKYKPGVPLDSTKWNKKKVGKGAALCADTVNKIIYATKGNSTYEFFAYDIATNTWSAKAFLPTIKAPKVGTSIAYLGGYVYLLAGGLKNTDIFFKYDIAGDSWMTLANPSYGVKPWKAGSAITEFGGKIYAMKGGDKPNYFVNYDPVSGWVTTNETLTTFDSVWSGSKWKLKKVYLKDGAAIVSTGDAMYAMKGGGKHNFFSYTPATGWVQLQLDTIPRLHKKSVPKTGAALAYTDGQVWLIKGNNNPEFWCYTIPTTKVDKKIETPYLPVTIVPTQTEIITHLTPLLQVTPNPFSKTTVVNYTVPVAGSITLKLYDITGGIIKTITNGYHNAGTYTINLSNIASGVYFLRYENVNSKTEMKLIVQ
jgi:hypothetical protein